MQPRVLYALQLAALVVAFALGTQLGAWWMIRSSDKAVPGSVLHTVASRATLRHGGLSSDAALQQSPRQPSPTLTEEPQQDTTATEAAPVDTLDAFAHLYKNTDAYRDRAPRQALVTMLDNDKYIAGAITLAYSLRTHGNVLPFLVMYPDNIELPEAGLQLLERAGCVIKRMPAVKDFIEVTERRKGMYNKLAMWTLDEEYDLLLFMDADGFALGRIEDAFPAFETAAAEYYKTSNGTEALVGAVPGMNNPLNAGVLAIRASTTIFNEMLDASTKITGYAPDYAEQAFLTKFVGNRWVVLSRIFNLEVNRQVSDKKEFNRVFPDVRFLHYSGREPRVMRERIQFAQNGTQIAGTTEGKRVDPLDALWNDAWTDARRLLQLPVN